MKIRLTDDTGTVELEVHEGDTLGLRYKEQLNGRSIATSYAVMEFKDELCGKCGRPYVGEGDVQGPDISNSGNEGDGDIKVARRRIMEEWHRNRGALG